MKNFNNWISFISFLGTKEVYTNASRKVLKFINNFVLLKKSLYPSIVTPGENGELFLIWNNKTETLEIEFGADDTDSWFYRNTPENITAGNVWEENSIPADLINILERLSIKWIKKY